MTEIEAKAELSDKDKLPDKDNLTNRNDEIAQTIQPMIDEFEKVVKGDE